MAVWVLDELKFGDDGSGIAPGEERKLSFEFDEEDMELLDTVVGRTNTDGAFLKTSKSAGTASAVSNTRGAGGSSDSLSTRQS